MQNITARQLRDKIAAGEIKAVDVTKEVLGQIEKHDGTIGSYLEVFANRAMAQASEIDKKIAAGEKVGSLAGVPVAVKDNMCTEWGHTSCGSKMLGNYQSPFNAHVIEKLIEADAIIIGKTNMDEFAMGSSCENSALKKTVNPWATDRVPGGSSGGSAAAVAGQLCYGSLGSDTGGSIRQPASFCGITGLKPTYGRVSRYGLVAYGSSLDQIGPFGFDVADNAMLLNVIAGHDKRDSTSVDEAIAPVPDYLANLDKPIEGLKIGVPKEFFNVDGLDKQVQEKVQAALEVYKANGAELVEVSLPNVKYAIATYYLVATAEASGNLARYDGVHYGHRTANPKDYIDVYNASREEGFGDEVKRRIMLGTYALSAGYYDAYYLKALKVRNLIRGDFVKAFETVDCIMCPTSPEVAFKQGAKTDDPLKMYLSDIYTIATNLAGIPGISIPCGFNDEGMPVGLQIMTGAFTEDRLFRIAQMYQNMTEFHKQLPSL
ncbi:MAG: Asp-tRNA(Asn)/Glu-tRNA(Gln) amidotransferase subunit GatA [Phycisphaerae bacterium]|nr:Asp-tRNA(Asn)/Glu-tRNA(Gln) amidotransferase subunit GatA [Phycisphaerae bacterium]